MELPVSLNVHSHTLVQSPSQGSVIDWSLFVWDGHYCS